MARMTRFGVSLEQGLLERFDRHVGEAGHRNRSAALREIIRQYLVAQQWDDSTARVAAVVGLVYHNSSHDVLRRLQEIKIRHRAVIVADSQHYLHAQYTLNVVVLAGDGRTVRQATEQLKGCRGVVHGDVIPAVPGPPCGGE
jgi:CopG family nickel-responsive transcriptional regulator